MTDLFQASHGKGSFWNEDSDTQCKLSFLFRFIKEWESGKEDYELMLTDWRRTWHDLSIQFLLDFSIQDPSQWESFRRSKAVFLGCGLLWEKENSSFYDLPWEDSEFWYLEITYGRRWQKERWDKRRLGESLKKKNGKTLVWSPIYCLNLRVFNITQAILWCTGFYLPQ